MERITHSTRLVDANGSGRDGYTEGTPGVTPASVVEATALNFIQEEIARAIELLGGTLSSASQEQLGTLLVSAFDAEAAAREAISDALMPSPSAGGMIRIPLSFLRPMGAGALTFGGTAGEEVTVTQNATYICPLGLLLQSSTHISAVFAIYSCTAAPGTGTLINLYQVGPDFDTPAAGTPTNYGSGATANVTGPQLVFAAPVSDVDVLNTLGTTEIKVTIPNVAGTHKILGLAVQYTVGYPRGY